MNDEIDTYTIYALAKQLIGPINPVGETHTDNKRFENLESFYCILSDLLDDFSRVALDNQNCHEASRKKAADYVAECLNDIERKIQT